MTLPKTVRTKRLELRQFSASDGPAVLAYSQDPDWVEFQQTAPSTEREAERVVAELILRDWTTEPAWAITLSEDVVGVVSLAFSAEHQIALLGFGIHSEHRGLGLATEAIRAVLNVAFEGYPRLARVGAHTDLRNKSSQRVLEKLGFVHEGTIRSGGVTAKGLLSDGAIYGLLRLEWQS